MYIFGQHDNHALYLALTIYLSLHDSSIYSVYFSKDLKACNCTVSNSSLIGGSGGAGWEGTALLHHGSAVKVGCLQFVFSIVDQAPDIQYGRGSGKETSQKSSSQSNTNCSSSISSRQSSMPLISSSQFLHSQSGNSLQLKTQFKFSQMS